MADVKIVFFDIDGTLLNFGAKTITPKIRETLDKLRQKGVKLCIATGRSPVSLPAFAKEGFDAWLTFNGSYCYDRAGEIFSNPVDHADIRRVKENAARIGRPIAVATKDRMAANGWDQDLEDYYGFTEIPLEVASDFDAVCEEKVYQIMVGCREADYGQLLEGVTQSKIVAWWNRAADIIPQNGGKDLGVAKVLAHYGLAKEEALAFGDGNNDLEMLLAVGTGVAMGNGSAELKAVAAEICPPVSEDGVYQYCLEKGLIK